MQFRFYEDNSDERFAGVTFRAGYVEWSSEENDYVEVAEKTEHSYFAIWNPESGWQTVMIERGFGELIK